MTAKKAASLLGCWTPILAQQSRLFCDFEGDLLRIGNGRKLNYALTKRSMLSKLGVEALLVWRCWQTMCVPAWDISIFFWVSFLVSKGRSCLRGWVQVLPQWFIKAGVEGTEATLLRCGEFFIVLSTAVNTNDSKAVEKALNEFQHFNVLQVPNCTNLRSLAIQYLLNNSIYFILWIHSGKPW